MGKATKIPNNYSLFVWSQFLDLKKFKEITKNFTDDQWRRLIQLCNDKIVNNLENKEIEKIAIEKIEELIAKDDVLKIHNITITELASTDIKHYFIVKVYFVCGAYFIEGEIKQIISELRDIVKENKLNIKAFCPSCSSKRLRFADRFCLCNECGALSILEECRVVKQYKIEDKQFWWAQAIGEIGSRKIT